MSKKFEVSKSAAASASGTVQGILNNCEVSYRLECLERRLAQLSSDFRDDFFPTLEKMRQFWQQLANELERKKTKKTLFSKIKEFLTFKK